MAKLDLAGVWVLSCGKAGFAPIPARLPGDNCSALIGAGVRDRLRGKELRRERSLHRRAGLPHPAGLTPALLARRR